MMIIPETYHFEVVSVLLIKSFVTFRSSYEVKRGHLFRLLFIYLRFENPTHNPQKNLKKSARRIPTIAHITVIRASKLLGSVH